MSVTKPDILIFSDWFEPGFRAGGPIRSLANMVYAMRQFANFHVVTSNGDLGVIEPYEGIESNVWIERPYGKIIYLSNEGYHTMINEILKLDVKYVYLNSLFSYNYTISLLPKLKKLNKKIVLAPRGMLSTNALAQKKVKKSVFLQLAKLRGLYKNVLWHATSEDEEKGIKKYFGDKAQVVRISNFPALKQEVLPLSKARREIVYGLVGRIASIKNIDLAISWMAKVQGKVLLKIAGPIEDAFYLEKCEKLVAKLPSHIKVEFCGAMQPAEMSGFYQSIHAFFLPTQTENFGHAIVEALAHGKPCIISDKTPWNDIQDFEAGFAISLDKEDSFVKALQGWSDLNEEQYKKLCLCTQAYFDIKFNPSVLIEQYLKLFDT
ncbi:MAG: glycosyltransferase family 4 protein [Flavobacteriales bacterium]